MNSSPEDEREHTTEWNAIPAVFKDPKTSGAIEGVAETGFYGVQPAGDATPSADATRPVELPRSFGRYEVRGLLGRGGFGTVYVGHDSQLDRKVAIKVPHGVTPAHAPQAFLSEARRLAQLRHPGIVAVHDVGVQDGRVYIVTDFLEGVSLRDRLRQGGIFCAEAVEMIARIADALMHAHAQQIIHRDVKPANIMLTRDGHPVLLDFGLALSAADATGAERRIIGTPAFMSPEQVQGLAHRLDGRTDIFSLGVVLYRLLCDRLPFLADSTAETLRRIVEDAPQPPRQLVPHLPVELERVCLKALAKRSEERYATARDFAEDLRQAAQAGAADASSAPTTAQPAPRAAADSERRRLTLLVCGCESTDVAGPLDLLDAEDQHTIQQAFHQFCADVAGPFGGTLLPAAGRDVCICFGYPTAHEDAAVRGVRTGLALLEGLPRLNEPLHAQLGVRLALWAGVHTGQAVASAADFLRSEGISIVGEARNVAARLEPLSEPGAVVFTEATRQLTRGFFDCESRGSHAVKGVAAPLELFRVLGEKARHRLEADVPAGLTPLVGRDTELAILRDRWEQTVDGMGQVVLLIGEAGLGKSRLVHELKAHVGQGSAAGDLPVIEWRCSAYHQNSSLNPASDFLSRYLRFSHDDTPGQRLERLAGHLKQLQLTDPETVALFAALLCLPPTEGAPVLSPQRLRERTREVLLEWLDACVARQPVLFIVEDLHWIDPSSLELLAAHVERGPAGRMLTVLTFRPEFETPWKSKAHQTQIALNRLNKRQTADLMRRQAGRDRLPQSVIDEVTARTDGIPLFVEEFTRVLMEAPGVQDAEGDSSASVVLKRQEVPASLLDLLLARLDRLASNREVVQLAATLGREFSHELLRAVCGLDEVTLQAELDKLVRAELLFRKGRPPRVSYLFKHALLQDAAYQSMLKKKRQQQHQKIADVLVARFPELAENEPEVVAQHYAEAGLAARSVPYWLQAGLRSQGMFANTEAIRHFTRGLELLATLDQTPERDRQELRLQLPLGTALLATRGYAAPEVGPVFARARELCETSGDTPQLAAVLWGNWAWHVVRGDFRLCMDLGRELMDLARAAQDPGIQMEALFTPGLTMLYRGDFAGARQHCEQGIALYDAERCKRWSAYTGQNSGVTHRCYLALALWHLGHPDQALRVSWEAIALARQIAHPFSLCYALHHAAWLQQHCRQGQLVQAAGEELIAVAVEQGFAIFQATGTLYRAAGLLQLGRAGEALAQLHQGLATYRALGAELALPFYLSILAQAHSQAGQPEDGLSALAEGLAFAAKNEDVFQEAELHRLRGELLLTRAATAVEAEACFQQAIGIARRQQAKSWELRATMSLARLCNQQGNGAEAQAALAAVHGWFTEGFATPDLVEANALLGC